MDIEFVLDGKKHDNYVPSRIRKLDIFILITFDLSPTPNAFAFYSMDELIECFDAHALLGHFPILFRRELFMLPGHPLYDSPNATILNLPSSNIRKK